MVPLKQARERVGISQRRLAAKARLAYKTVQLMESKLHDPRLSTLDMLATALGYPKDLVQKEVGLLFESSPHSIRMISKQIARAGEASWKVWLFNFVDHFRNDPKPELVELSPCLGISERMMALIASTVETLCEEQGLAIPAWCEVALLLTTPWFVSGAENLKACALVESPVHFRKRNIFVLSNFLERR